MHEIERWLGGWFGAMLIILMVSAPFFIRDAWKNREKR